MKDKTSFSLSRSPNGSVFQSLNVSLRPPLSSTLYLSFFFLISLKSSLSSLLSWSSFLTFLSSLFHPYLPFLFPVFSFPPYFFFFLFRLPLFFFRSSSLFAFFSFHPLPLLSFFSIPPFFNSFLSFPSSSFLCLRFFSSPSFKCEEEDDLRKF